MADVNDLVQRTEKTALRAGQAARPRGAPLRQRGRAAAADDEHLPDRVARRDAEAARDLRAGARSGLGALAAALGLARRRARSRQDQRYAIAYWFSLLSVFDSSGPAVFARAMIHTYETHEEDPIRKCFFSITRDEVNHEEVCGRAIQLFTPGGPLGYEPQTPLGKLARNNVEWLYHNGARYWEALQEGRAQVPGADPLHLVPVRRDGVRHAVPLDAPAHHDPGAQGGVPLHRPGRGAPSRHLPRRSCRRSCRGSSVEDKQTITAPAARGLRVPLGRALRAAAATSGSCPRPSRRRTGCSRTPRAAPASAC